MADIGAEALIFTADPQPLEAGLDRMGADIAGFGQRAAALESPPAPTGPAHMGAAAGLGRRGVLQTGEDVGQLTATFDAGMGKALKEAEEDEAHFRKQLNEAEVDADQLTHSLEVQAATLGMSTHEAELYKLALKGASEESLAGAKAAAAHLQEAKREHERGPALGARLKEAAAGVPDAIRQSFRTGEAFPRIASVGAQLLERPPEGQTRKPSEALAPLKEVASMLPGPLGAIAGTITGALGSVFDALTKESRLVAERAGNALASIATGAANAGNAVANVRLDSMTEDMRNIMRDAASGRLTANDNVAGEANVNAALRTRLTEAESRANRSAGLTQRIAENPEIAAQVERIAELRVRQQGNEAVQVTREATQQDSLAGGMAAAGVDAGRTADALERQALAQRLAREASISLEEANNRLANSMAGFAQVQEQRRRAEASRQTGESIRSGREDLDLTQRRFEVIRNLDPFVADMTREEQELARMRRQGADAGLLQQRATQIEQTRAAREQEQALQAGRQLTEQTRNPLETFQREEARLDELRDRGAISDEVYNRGLEQATLQAERAAGEAPVGQAAMTEGSVAAASAIARANRQMERENPQARTERLLGELNSMARDQRDRVRDLAGALTQGRVFRAVNAPA